MARSRNHLQLSIFQTPIDEVVLSLYSRDQMSKLLRGIQEVYKNEICYIAITDLLLADITKNSKKEDKNKGAPAFTAWAIFVLISLRQNGSYDYDQLADFATNHIAVREIMGLCIPPDKAIPKSTIHDNIKLVKPETIQKINEIVVGFGHSLLNSKKKDLETVADTFVYETNIHFHTDYGSIYDGVRCLLRLGDRLASKLNLLGFRKKSYIEKRVKRYCREIGMINRSRRNDKEEAIQTTFIQLIKLMVLVFDKSIKLLNESDNSECKKIKNLREEIIKFLKVTCYEAGLAKRRILSGEQIDASEKIFSIFEAHTELICKGKAKAPMEFGHRVLVVQDQFGFVLTCKRVESGLVDAQIIVEETKDVKKKYGKIGSLSLDKGFWSPENHTSLSNEVGLLVMPNKGKNKSHEDQTKEYKKLRRKHSRVESCINALESGNNLHICLDKGLNGFDMAVACAGLARNLHVLGNYLQQKEKNKQQFLCG